MNRRYTLKAALGAIAGLFAGNAVAKSSDTHVYNIVSPDKIIDKDAFRRMYSEVTKELVECGEVAITGDEQIVVNSVGANAVNKVDQTKYLETRVYELQVHRPDTGWVDFRPPGTSVLAWKNHDAEEALLLMDKTQRNNPKGIFRLIKNDVIIRKPWGYA